MARFASLLLFLALFLCAACSPAASSPAPIQPTSTPAGELTPYTPIPAPSLTPSPALATLPGPVPSPTPTPLTYTVQAKDDMLSIALRFGVSLEALLAANPKVNPRAMSVGAVLVIPPSGKPQPTAQNPSPTPLPARLAAPDCWPAGDGGMWCFVLAGNAQPGALESLSALVRVAGQNDSPLLEREAYGLLDLLPPGKTLPLAVYFPAPVPAPFRASAELLTAFPLPSGGTRYVELQLRGAQTRIAADGLSAQVSGQVGAAAGASTAWIAATALDAQGRVVGVRRWESPQPLRPGQPADFSLTVYSLAGPIVSVDLLTEGKP